MASELKEVDQTLKKDLKSMSQVHYSHSKQQPLACEKVEESCIPFLVISSLRGLVLPIVDVFVDPNQLG
jgi:hypothetical protein